MSAVPARTPAVATSATPLASQEAAETFITCADHRWGISAFDQLRRLETAMNRMCAPCVLGRRERAGTKRNQQHWIARYSVRNALSADWLALCEPADINGSGLLIRW